MKIPIAKQKIFISEFERKRPLYEKFSDLLNSILQKAVDQLGYLAIIKFRTKEVESFSNKIIMKDKYQDPLNDVTDLCGGRVIVQFQSQVVDISEWIKKNFTIDEANSLDHKSKLKVNEFGYRSIHYIVTPTKSSIIGIPVPKEFRTLKAEIQVRTLAEHMWADISHDRLYKTDLIIPEEWKREAARLSAILESADDTFGSMSEAVDSVSNTFEMQNETVNAKNNIEKLETLVEIRKKEPVSGVKNVLKLVRIYLTLNKIVQAEVLLGDWITIMKGNLLWESRLTFELIMLCLTCCKGNTSKTPESLKSGTGLIIHCPTDCQGNLTKAQKEDLIQKALDCLDILDKLYRSTGIPGARELSFLNYRLGCFLQSELKSKEAIKVLNRALELMPDNPLCLTALTESMVLQNIALSRQIISLFRSSFEKNIEDLLKLISLGIDAIPAWFAIGHCHFFLGNRRECIKAYSNAVAVIVDMNLTSNCYVINSEILRAERLSDLDEKLAKQILVYLNIAMTVSDVAIDKEPYKNSLLKMQLRKEELKKPVVILAGGAALMDKEKIESYSEYIRELMNGFRGTIISGGTKEGIPGLAGRIKEDIKKSGITDFELIAYLPEKLPNDAKIYSRAYDQIYRTKSDEFSALDILACWTDIILSGIPPSEVILIGINGGEIADLEYRIALSLGAKVCLIAYSGRAVSDLSQEKQWKNHPNLIIVPNDPLTVWAIVNHKKPTVLSPDEIENLAPLVHEFYREKRVDELKPTETDVNKYKVIMRWKKLDPALQESNRLQVAYYENLLKRVNLGIRPAEKPVLFDIKNNLQKRSVICLHGWNMPGGMPNGSLKGGAMDLRKTWQKSLVHTLWHGINWTKISNLTIMIPWIISL